MSYIYPDTRDQRRIANSNNKTLMQNWVEERAVEHYDKIPESYGDNPQVKYFKGGHKGLITIKDTQPMNTPSTYVDNFTAQDPVQEEAKGLRYRLTEQMLMKKLVAQMEEEENLKNDWCDEPVKYVSETQEQFIRPGFVHQKPAPTAKHDLYSEMPVSYWTEKRNRVHGVTQFKTLDTPFRRNAAFSTPIGETYETPMPHDLENYPYLSQQSNNNGPLM